MKRILIIGAGRSASACINYCLNQTKESGWFVTVADASLEMAQKKVGEHPNALATQLDVMKSDERESLIGKHDIVVSLLPAHLHLLVAKDCIKLKKHLVTASYVSKEMYDLADQVSESNLIFMGEMGLDPGIDHMSTMKLINELREDKEVQILSFKSYTGGLIAPESDDNPWHYKFTWNPRNVVLAGQGTAQFMEEGKYKYTPYSRLFSDHSTIDVPGMGTYEVYPNRDSLPYRDVYGVSDIPTILRGTVRCEGFCKAWDALIKIGLTDNSYNIHDTNTITYKEWMNSYFPEGNDSLEERVAAFLGEDIDSEIMQKLTWLGLFSDIKIDMETATPAQILEKLLLSKWTLKPEDKDMIIMQHEVEYIKRDVKKRVISSMVMKGENAEDTSMARLVGLPLAIFVKLVADGKVTTTGLNIPVMREVYEPVLEELEQFGVVFKETILEI